MSEDAISAQSVYHGPPPHSDAPWVNSPILFTSGPLRGKWIRAELVVQQQPRRGRKGAIHDLRPLHPPPTVRLKLWEILHPVPPSSIIPNGPPETLYFHQNPVPPPPNAQAVPVPMVPRLTTHFLCFASLFKVQPPTREQEYGRVDRKVMVGLPEGPVPQDSQYMSSVLPPGEVIERPKSDKIRAWKAVRPHPMTAISSRDPQWPTAVAQAWARLGDDGEADSPMELDSDANKDAIKDIETVEGDLSFNEMLLLESLLPREAPKWVFPYQDVTTHLSKRETAGHLIPSVENGEPAFYFVFTVRERQHACPFSYALDQDLAIRNEGYFSLRFHIVNLDWRVHPQFSRPGTGFFSPLCDCVTTPFAVYSTKEFPGLPPTTEFTAYLVRNGVRIRFRDDRGVDAAVGELKGRGEGRTRTTRKNSAKSTTQPSPELTEVQIGNGEASSIPISLGGRDNDNSRKEALLAASQIWKSSPGGGDFHRTFDADELGNEVPDMVTSPLSPRHRPARSHTVSAMRGTSSPIHSPTFQGRRSYSNPTLDPSIYHSPNPERTTVYHEQQYASTFAPGAPHSAIQRSMAGPSAHNYLINQEYTNNSSDQRWSSVSPQSPHTSIPSPGYPGQPKWIEDEMDPPFARLSTPSGSVHQSPIMMRERSNHRYYPYPPATTSHVQSQPRSFEHDMPGTSPLSAYPPQGPNSGGYPPSNARQTFDGNN